MRQSEIYVGLDVHKDTIAVAVVLHVAADHRAVEHIERGEERSGAVTLVIVGHRPAAPLLQRQSRLRAIERLDLTFLVD